MFLLLANSIILNQEESCRNRPGTSYENSFNGSPGGSACRGRAHLPRQPACCELSYVHQAGFNTIFTITFVARCFNYKHTIYTLVRQRKHALRYIRTNPRLPPSSFRDKFGVSRYHEQSHHNFPDYHWTAGRGRYGSGHVQRITRSLYWKFTLQLPSRAEIVHENASHSKLENSRI